MIIQYLKTMTSLNNRQRKIRRFGVIARIELVDVDNENPNDLCKEEEVGEQYKYLSTPTAVTVSIVGKKRCEILGSSNNNKDTKPSGLGRRKICGQS